MQQPYPLWAQSGPRNKLSLQTQGKLPHLSNGGGAHGRVWRGDARRCRHSRWRAHRYHGYDTLRFQPQSKRMGAADKHAVRRRSLPGTDARHVGGLRRHDELVSGLVLGGACVRAERPSPEGAHAQHRQERPPDHGHAVQSGVPTVQQGAVRVHKQCRLCFLHPARPAQQPDRWPRRGRLGARDASRRLQQH